jgi:hypothetical protein
MPGQTREQGRRSSLAPKRGRTRTKTTWPASGGSCEIYIAVLARRQAKNEVVTTRRVETDRNCGEISDFRYFVL